MPETQETCHMPVWKNNGQGTLWDFGIVENLQSKCLHFIIKVNLEVFIEDLKLDILGQGLGQRAKHVASSNFRKLN